MRKLLSILFFIFVTNLSYGQTFTQTFVDRCTGEVQIVTADFTSGSAVVSFYNKVKLFTYNQYINGELQSWLVQQYAWWAALSPCSSATTQTQNATNNANNATNNNNSGSSGSSGSSGGGDSGGSGDSGGGSGDSGGGSDGSDGGGGSDGSDGGGDSDGGG